MVSRQGGSLTEDGGGRVGGASGDHTAQSTDLYVNEPPFPLFFYKPLCNFDSAYPSSWTRDRAPSVITGVSLFLIFLPLFQSPQGSSPPPWWGNSVCSCECVQEALHPHSWMLRSSGPQPGTPFRPGLPRGQAPWGTESPPSCEGTAPTSVSSPQPGAEGGESLFSLREPLSPQISFSWGQKGF